MSPHSSIVASAVITLVFVAFGNRVQNAEHGWTPDALLTVKRVGPVVPSPDGTLVAFVVSQTVMEGEKSEWLSHIHVAKADGSDTFQLTQGDKSATQPRWSPDGRWIAFLSARGTEKDKVNLFRIRLGGGEAEALTNEKSSITAFEWAPDGTSIAFVMADPKSEDEEKASKEKRDARVVDADEKLARLYVVPVEKNADGKRPPKGLTSGPVHVTGLNWSPDSATIVFSHQRTTKVFEQNDISTVAVSGGNLKPVVATGAMEDDPVFSPDGRSIAYTVSDDPPTWAFTAWVHVMPTGGGPARALAKTFDEQPSILGWSEDGRVVYVQEVHGTVARISTLPVDGGAPSFVTPPDLNPGGAMLNRNATTLGFAHAWSEKAPEAYVARIQPFAATQVSRVQTITQTVQAPLGRTEVIRWKASDGLAVEGLLTYPAGYAQGTRVPLLVIVHGGPTGVFTQSFIGTPGPYPIAIFASRGYAILRCNVRGSSGYGRKFRYANYQDWGGGDYRDIMSGVDHVIGLGVADPDRLGIMGWSYGGYMTSWVITQTKRFKAASVGAGVTNLMSFTGTADIPGFIPDYFGGEYWDVLDRWRARSAMFNVKGVTTPTLIQHGEEDRRVPVSQGYELYNALLRQRVPVKMIVYPRQPHGIQEPKLIKDTMDRNLEWFDRWILRRGETSTASRNER
jgi:dipeptidyl aminopeptidase/acylaminoacyl peptidase